MVCLKILCLRILCLRPSGLLVKKRKLQVQQFFINDPHEKKGGFGRSTAEFLSLYLASSALGSENDLKRNPKEINCEILRKTYQQLHADKQLHDKGLPPSGADLLAQSMGGISWVHPNESEFSSYSWPWSGQSFFVFRTGKKLPTHNHLQNLKLNSSHRLEILASKVFQSFRQKNWRPFVDGVNLYSDHLHELGLADEEVRERCLQLRNHNFVDGAKGCGAMGLDTVLVLGKIENKESIFQVAKKLDLQFVASSTDVYQISSEKINGDHAKKLDTERGL